MEANHPIFLPRLVPHVFNRRQSSTQLTMPSESDRSTSPMSIRSEPAAPRSPTPMSDHLSDPVLQRSETTTLMDALVLGNGAQYTARAILDHYEVAPNEVLAIIAMLSSGTDNDKSNLARLIQHLYSTNRVAARAILWAYLTGEGKPVVYD